MVQHGPAATTPTRTGGSGGRLSGGVIASLVGAALWIGAGVLRRHRRRKARRAGGDF